MKSPSEKGPKSFSRLMIAAVPLSIWLCTPASVLGQSSGCVLVPDDRKPSEKILRCGSNLTIRMESRRFTRLTNAFSKKLEYLKAAIALHFGFYNFCRVHSSLRVTPCMSAGITDHVWNLEELLS